MCWQSECLSIHSILYTDLNADIQRAPSNYFQGRSCEVVDPSTRNIQSLPALCARWPKVYNVLFVCERRVYSNGHHVNIKVFHAFRGILFLSKTILLIHSLCIYWDRWCMRCITGILHQGICTMQGGWGDILLILISLNCAPDYHDK